MDCNPEPPSKTYRTSHASSEYGKRYSRTYSQGYYYHQWEQIEKPILKDLLDEQRRRGAKSLLDFACGCGRILSVCERDFETAWGVDVSESMLAEAKNVCPMAKLVLRDITRDPLDRTFDVATAFRFFLNAEPALRAEALQAIRQALNPGGVLIANIHVNSRSLQGLVYRLRNKLRGRISANTLAWDDFNAILREHGFQIEKTVWYGYWPRTGFFMDGLASKMIRPVESLWHTLRLPPSVAQAYVCVCSKVEAPATDTGRSA